MNLKQKTILQSLLDYVVILNSDGVIQYINHVSAGLTEEIIGSNFLRWLYEKDRPKIKKAIKNTLDSGTLSEINVRSIGPERKMTWFNIKIIPMPDVSNQQVLLVATDINKNKTAEDKFENINRLYFFISEVNQMIIRTTDEITLFKEACRIAVEFGNFRMAWIGIIDETTKEIIPFIHAGKEEGYLSKIKIISTDDEPEGRGPVGTALRAGRYIVCNDIETASQMAPWKKEALSRGYLSTMAMPIINSGKVIAVFTLYASEKDFFNPEEIALFKKLMDNISYVLENFKKEKKRKKNEETLNIFNERFQMMATTTNDGLWEWNLETGELWANPMHQQLYGLTTADPVPDVHQWEQKLHPNDRERIFSLQRNALASDKHSWISEYRFETKNGFVDIYDRTYIVRNAAGKAIHLTGSMTDISERKKTERQLAASEIQYRRLFETSKDGILIIDAETGFIKDVNHFLIEQLDYSYKEFIGKQIWEISLFKDIAANQESFKKLQKKGYVRYENLPLQTKSGKAMWVEFISNTYPVNGNQIIQCNIRDITDRKKAEDEIQYTNEQLRQLTAHLQTIREEERKRIAREIHDELGQQLTAIKMDAVWIDKKTEATNGPVKNKLKNIIALLDGSNQAVRKILSELRPGNLENKALTETMEWQSRQFTESSGIPVLITSTETSLRLSEEAATCIFRVYQESLTNIMRYAQAKNVSTSLSPHGDDIVLVVEDDGIGFDLVDVQHKKTFGLLGMKERVLSLNGNFELTSVKGKGTKIVISLPYKNT